jgi:hypothetical protein
MVTRDVESRVPTLEHRMVLAYFANGDTYRIELTRFDANGSAPRVFVGRLAPFVKRK